MTYKEANRYISVLYRYGQRFFVEELSRRGCELGVGQMPSLLQTWKAPGITQEGISQNTGMDKGTTARAVKSLEETGLIHREADPQDRRVNHITLTPAGEAMIPVLLEVIQKYHQWLFRGFSPEEEREATAYLLRLQNNALGAAD